MKKPVRIVLILLIVGLIFFIGCVSHPSPVGKVTLHFHFQGDSIDEVLTPEEAAEIRSIFFGHYRHFQLLSKDSCGYDEDISIQIGGTYYCPAQDKCTGIWNSTVNMYFDLTEAQRARLEKMFEAHGGHFPCI